MTAVSVLMPCRNAVRTLPEALGSLWAQSFRDFDVIAVDDGSTDDTLRMLRAAAARETRMRVFTGAHSGIASALERARAEADAPLLARMDADDRLDPRRFALQVEHFRREPALSVSCSKVTLFPRDELADGYLRYESWVNRILTHDAIRKNLFVESPVPHPTVMIRSGALNAAGGYRDVGWLEDYDLWMRLMFSGHRFAKLDMALLEWRDGPDRASRVQAVYSAERFADLKEHYLRAHVLPRGRPVAVWGAGPVGKSWAKRLKPTYIVELDPAKIGQRIHGATVISSEELDRLGDAYVVAAVGALSRRPLASVPFRAARDEIRAALERSGLTELDDFVCVA